MIKVLFFGMGSLYNAIIDTLDLDKVEIVGYTDSFTKKLGTFFGTKPIIPMEFLREYSFDYILVASLAYDSIKEQLLTVGVAEDRIVGCCINNSNFYNKCADKFNLEIEHYMKYTVLKSIMKNDNYIESTYFCNMPMLGRKREITIDHREDYVRLSTLELVAYKVKSENIPGAVAELGVYRGDFARHINSLFCDRKFYLFDTFEGFNKVDIDTEFKKTNKDMSLHFNLFSDTNIEIVLQKMMRPHQCILKKGYFPESIGDLEEVFAFVSIDADLYQPIYEGLKYFYPRLSKGGYIFVHDFNNFVYPGVKTAVEQYCRENNLSYCPISDTYGSVIITK